jgi:hypothetical protein
VEFHADVVIEMKGEETEVEPKYFLQHLIITKSRFQRSVLGWHQYKIAEDGLQVFPSIHYRMHAVEDQRPVGKPTGRPSIAEGYDVSLKPMLDAHGEEAESNVEAKTDGSVLGHILGPVAMTGGNFTVVLGPRRAWKTLLTFDWLRAGSLKGEVGLLASLMENEVTILKQRRKLCEYYCRGTPRPDKCVGAQCYRSIYLYPFRPGCVSPGEFLHYLCQSVGQNRKVAGGEEAPVGRFLFWDLMQLEHRFPLLAADPLFLPGLVDYLKYVRRIPSVFMGAPNTRFARTASAIADNVVFCWQDIRKQDDAKGWCFYVDRIEGQPEHGRLHFLKEAPSSPARTVGDLLGADDADEDANKYRDAVPWIGAIREMQGLSLGLGPDVRRACPFAEGGRVPGITQAVTPMSTSDQGSAK